MLYKYKLCRSQCQKTNLVFLIQRQREILILFFVLWFLYNAMTKEPVYKESGRSF